MIKNLYIIIVVVLRFAGLYLVARGLFGIPFLAFGIGIPFLAFLLPILGGILLWWVAKPCATLIMNDLE